MTVCHGIRAQRMANIHGFKRLALRIRVKHIGNIPVDFTTIAIAKIDPETRIDDLTTEHIIALRKELENIELKLEGDLRRFNSLNIKRLNDLNCHRGKRHRNSLPVRGQRTRTNARTRRGSKKTVTGKKK